MSEHQDRRTTQDSSGEQAYEADARRWLRVYPPRWRRAREDEVLGVLLDTRPPGARRLPAGTRADLVRGSVAYRWHSHPPLVAWLMWRFNQSRLPPRYAEWVRDDVEGRWFPLRKVWGGGLVAFVAAAVLLHAAGVLDVPWWGLVFVLVVSGVAMLAERGEARQRTLDDAVGWQRRIEQVRDPDGPRWSGARRWSWGRWLVGPVVAGWLGVLAVAVVAAAALGSTGAAGPASTLSRAAGASAVSPVLPLWVAVWTAVAVTVVAVCRSRARSRPPQPWRADLRRPPTVAVAAVTALAAGLPLVVVAAPLGVMIGAVDDPSPLIAEAAPVVAALAPLSWGTGFLGTPLLLFVLLTPVVHLRVRGELAARPDPAPALLDVIGLHGGREVLTDPPRVPADPVPWV